jgi:hypothetical protein
MPRINLPLCGSDLENLRASGLTDLTICENNLRTEGAALVFPYRDLDGNVNGFTRRRPHVPRVIDGKEAKYLQDKGTPLRAYFPHASLAKLRDGTSPVYITEGEKKALALAQLSIAAVGIGGIWCGCEKDTEELIDYLAAVPWEGRTVYIVYDYDPKPSTQREADIARTRLARALKAAGAGEVYNVRLPPGPDGAKQGVDDYLVANGAEDFGRLVEEATPVIKIIPGGLDSSRRGGAIPVIKIIPPVLGEAAYHGPIGRFIRTVSRYTEATDAGILAHLLPAVGTIIGPGPYTHGTKQPARVNTVLVGPTSTGRKGTALAPVDELMSLVDAEFWKKQRVGGLSTGEGLVQKVADKETWNAETKEYDIEVVEKRLYVVEEEFSKVLAQLRREGNILSQILRESFDSGNLSVLTRGNPLQAKGAHISITGHITPEELHDRFNHIEMANGFGNRFLWFAVKSDKILGRSEPIPPKMFEQAVPAFLRVRNYPVGYIRLADASQGKWEEIYPALREDKPGFAGHLVARGSAMVLRLALLYYLLDPPPKGGSQFEQFKAKHLAGIQPVHLDAALAVWDYCVRSVEMLFRSKAGTFLGDKLLELLRDHGPMTKDVLNDHLSPKQKAEAAGVLASLEAAGLIRKGTKKPTGAGRPATVWESVQGKG